MVNTVVEEEFRIQNSEGSVGRREPTFKNAGLILEALCLVALSATLDSAALATQERLTRLPPALSTQIFLY